MTGLVVFTRKENGFFPRGRERKTLVLLGVGTGAGEGCPLGGRGESVSAKRRPEGLWSKPLLLEMRHRDGKGLA